MSVTREHALSSVAAPSGDRAKAEFYRDRVISAMNDVYAILEEAHVKDGLICSFAIASGPDGKPQTNVTVVRQVSLLD